METDLEDPEYLPNHWHSAVADIIQRVQESTAAGTAVGNAAIGSAVVNSTVSNQAVAGVAAAGDVAADTVRPHAKVSGQAVPGVPAAGHVVAVPDGSSPAGPGHQAPMAPSSPAISTVVVPILMPYPVPSGDAAVPPPPSWSPPSNSSVNSTRQVCLYLFVVFCK